MIFKVTEIKELSNLSKAEKDLVLSEYSRIVWKDKSLIIYNILKASIIAFSLLFLLFYKPFGKLGFVWNYIIAIAWSYVCFKLISIFEINVIAPKIICKVIGNLKSNQNKRAATTYNSQKNMKERSVNCRAMVLRHVELLAHPAMQMAYERSAPGYDFLSEYFLDFPFFPKDKAFIDAFSHDELLELAKLYGMIFIAGKRFMAMECDSVIEILKVSEWREVVAFAKDFEVELRRNC